MKVAKNLYFAVIAFLVIAVSLLSVTYAWIRSADNTIHAVVSGKVVQERFHTGDGTQSNPYVITKPIHYYHMVEFFQRETLLSTSSNNTTVNTKFGTDFIYFQLGYDFDNNGTYKVYAYNDQGDIILDSNNEPTYATELNMAYYSESNSLMPIGTSEIPFYGIFDGKGLVIKNLNIISTEVIPDPADETKTLTRQTADIGIFGYVKQASGINGKRTIIKDTYFENVTISLVDVDASATSTGHISTNHSSAYVGYLAGHVTIDETITDANDKKIFINTYINNCKVTGGNAAKSNFGLFGRVDNSQGAEIETLVETIQENIGTDPGANWGGSIDMLSLNKRLYFYLNRSDVKSYKLNTHGSAYNSSNSNTQRRHRFISDSSSDYAISVYSGNSTSVYSYYTTNPTTISGTGNLVYRLVGYDTGRSGFVISKTSDSNSGSQQSNITIPGSYFPLNVDEVLSGGTLTGYTTSSKNTGYIASAGFDGASTVRTAAYGIKFIGNSLSSSGTSSNSYVASQFEVMTNSTVAYSSSNYVRINDNYNSANTSVSSAMSSYQKTKQSSTLQKYDSSRSLLNDVLSGQSAVHGLHFQGTTISSSSTVTIPSASINNETITQYKVPTSSIDFTLQHSGFINFFAGSYYNTVGTNVDSFFSLHVITRSSDKKSISSIKEIKKIWTNTDSATKKDYPYVYQYKDSDTNDNNDEYSTGTKGTLVFDMQYLWEAPPVANAVYYFEIPVNGGEYALGSVSTSKTKGAYLMYLDISANGGDEIPEIIDEKGNAIIDLFDVDFRSKGDDISGNSGIMQLAYDALAATESNFKINVTFDSSQANSASYSKGLYIIDITNNTGQTIDLTVYLYDDDNNADTSLPYAYKIVVNGTTFMNNGIEYWKVCKTHTIPSS